MGGDGADGGCQAGFEYADPYLVRRDIREAQDSLVADVGGMGDLFPILRRSRHPRRVFPPVPRWWQSLPGEPNG